MFEQIPTSAAIGSCIIILLTIIVYRSVVKPYKQFEFYKRIISASYTTLSAPYNIFGIGSFGRGKRDYAEHHDSHYSMKTIYPKYQVVLSSFKGKTYVDLMDTTLIKEFYEKNLEGCYKKSMDSPMMIGLQGILGNGLLFSQGAEWKLKKKIMSSVFNFDFIKSKIKTICSIADQKMKQVEESQQNKGKSTVRIDLNNLFQRINGNVVIKCFFGDIKLEKLEGQEIFSYFNHLFQLNTQRSMTIFALLFPTLVYKYKVRAIDRQVSQMTLKFRQFATNIIIDQISSLKNKDEKSKQGDKFVGVIEKLVRQSILKQNQADNKGDKKDYYTVNDLIDQFATFFMAGTETTSNMATVLMYLLAKYPQVQTKVKKEIDDVFGGNIEDITFEKLKQLMYLQNVQKETLRMYSPTAGIFIRQVVKDHAIGNIPLKKGMLTSLKIKANHHKEEFYDHPMTFNPDRWNKLDSSKADPYSYFPFSAGNRNCIGQHLALIQSRIAIVMILKRYKTFIPDNLDFKMKMRVLYSVENMLTTFGKYDQPPIQ